MKYKSGIVSTLRGKYSCKYLESLVVIISDYRHKTVINDDDVGELLRKFQYIIINASPNIKFRAKSNVALMRNNDEFVPMRETNRAQIRKAIKRLQFGNDLQDLLNEED